VAEAERKIHSAPPAEEVALLVNPVVTETRTDLSNRLVQVRTRSFVEWIASFPWWAWLLLWAGAMIAVWSLIGWFFPDWVVASSEWLRRHFAILDLERYGVRLDVDAIPRWFTLLRLFDRRENAMRAWIDKRSRKAGSREAEATNQQEDLRGAESIPSDLATRSKFLLIVQGANRSHFSRLTPQLLGSEGANGRQSILVLEEASRVVASCVPKGKDEKGGKRPEGANAVTPAGLTATISHRLQHQFRLRTPPSSDLVEHLLRTNLVWLAVDASGSKSHELAALENVLLRAEFVNACVVLSSATREWGLPCECVNVRAG
jgi:hypothetical protein